VSALIGESDPEEKQKIQDRMIEALTSQFGALNTFAQTSLEGALQKATTGV